METVVAQEPCRMYKAAVYPADASGTRALRERLPVRVHGSEGRPQAM